MTDIVDQTLRLWRSTPFTWGGVVPHVPGYGDCLLSIGDYIAVRGGLDVSQAFRGSYSDEAGAMAHIDAAGGAVALVDRAGWPRTREPGRGDVAVINLGASGAGGVAVPYGALCTGDGFALRSVRGVVEIPVRFSRILKAWSCPL